MDIDGLVVREGDRATATGRLVRDDLGDWFEPAFPIAEPGGLERRVRAASNGAVRVAGADFDAAAGRFEKDGAVEGWATVTGTWSGEQLRVEKQDASVPDPAAPAARQLAVRRTQPVDQGPARRHPRPAAPALAALEPLPARTTALRRRPGPYHCPSRPGSPGDRDLGSLTPFGPGGP